MYFKYSQNDDKVLRGFNPLGLFILSILRILCVGVCISIFINCEVTKEWYAFFILFSYWDVALAGVTFLICVIMDYMRLIPYFFGLDWLENPKYNWYLGIVNILRDSLSIVTILELMISSGSFWMFVRFDFSLGYATIMAHLPVLIFKFINYMFMVVHIGWWSLMFTLIYAGGYYCFTIAIYYQFDGWWVYDIENPALFGKWWLLIVITCVGLSLGYFMMLPFNFIKNKLYVFFQDHFLHMYLKRQLLQFSMRFKEYIKSELFLISSTLMFVEFIGGVLIILSISKQVLGNPLLTIQLVFESLFCVFGLASLIFSLDFVFFSSDMRILRIAHESNQLFLILHAGRCLYALICLIVFAFTNLLWIFISTLTFALISTGLRFVLNYFLLKCDNFEGQPNALMRQGFFYVEEMGEVYEINSDDEDHFKYDLLTGKLKEFK